jgi:hypothetical protein
LASVLLRISRPFDIEKFAVKQEELPMLHLRRRNPASRPTIKPQQGVIMFQMDTRNWRDRVRALKAQQDVERGKAPDAGGQQDRP